MCVASLAAGSLTAGLSSCAGSKIYVVKSAESKIGTSPDGKIRVPISQFDDQNRLIVRTDLEQFDILLLRHSDMQPEFEALLLECTHQNNPVTVTSTGLFCPTHGSVFDLSGQVLQGPASRPLKAFKTMRVGDVVTIDLNS